MSVRNNTLENQNQTAIEAVIDMQNKQVDAIVQRRSKNLQVDMREVPAGSGTSNYESLRKKPSIETVTLIGDKTFEELGLSPISVDDLLDILT